MKITIKLLKVIITFSCIIFIQSTNAQTISSFPYMENFSLWTVGTGTPITTSSCAGWSSSTTSIPRWEREGATTGSNQSSSSTGAVWDHTGFGVSGGRYVFLECSGGSLGSTSYLESPTLNFGSNSIMKLKFWYHMYGSNIGSMEVEQYVSGTWVSTGWSKTGQQHASGSTAWTEAVIVISGSATKIRFKGVRGNGYRSDMAIDDVSINTVAANNCGISNIDAPSGSVIPGTHSIKVKLENFGSNTLTSATIKYKINNGTPVSYSWTGSIIPGASISNLIIANYTFPAGLVEIVTWTEIPNGVTDQDMTNDTSIATLYVCNALAGTYSVGDTASNFLTINQAINTIQNCGVSASAVFIIKQGIYNEQLTIGSIPGASSINTITFKSLTGNPDDVVLQYAASGTNDNWTLRLNGAQYVTFKQMTIKAIGLSYGRAVEFISGANHNVISYNKIITSTTSTTNDFVGIYSSTTLDQYNKITNNIIVGGNRGISLIGSSSSITEHGTIIEDNTITDFYSSGARISYQDSLQFNNNNIENRINSGMPSGASLSNCYFFKVLGNKIKINSLSINHGIVISNANANAANPNIVANNFISIYGIGTDNGKGLSVHNSNYVDLYYNSINVTSGSNTYDAVRVSLGSNIKVKNNIFVNLGGGYAYYIQTPSAILYSDYNVYYSSGVNFAYWTNNIPNLSSLKTANSKDTHSISVNPVFTSNTDLHINNSLINGQGIPIVGYTTDIDGDTRNATTPDIGADEFNLLSNDAGITNLIEPYAPCSGIASNIKVTLKNYGVQSLDSCLIGWSINGISQSPLHYGGALSAGCDTALSLGSYSFNSGAFYNLKVWSSTPNGLVDMNNNNDTLFVDSLQTSMPAGIYTIGNDTTYDYLSFSDAINSLHLKGICGPVIFNVASGIYNEQLTIHEIRGASSINTITFKSLSGFNTDVTVQYNSMSSIESWTIKLDGADNVIIKDMTIKANGQSYGKAIEMINGASYNTILGNHIECLGTSSSSFRCIYNGNTMNHFNSFINNKITGGYHGIYLTAFSESSRNKGTIIHNNEISGFHYSGINAGRQDSIQITNNYIHNGLHTYQYGIYASQCCNNFNISANNIILSPSNYATGLRVYRCNYYSFAVTSAPGLVSNNFISITSGTGINYGIYTYDSDNVKYYYNSVNITGGSSSSRTLYQTNDTLNTIGETFKNNVFANAIGGVSIRIETPANIVASDYNVLYTNGTTLAYWGTNASSLSALQTLSGKDLNSLAINPGFSSATNLHSNSSAINGQGTPIVNVTTDIDGETRNTTTPDIGADEFNLNNYDAGISNFVEPITPCPNSISNIKVTLKNFGILNLTSCAINWTINGVSQIPFSYTGNIPYNNIDTVTIGSYTFVNGVSYDIKIWPINPNGQPDANHVNDTLVINNIKTALSSGIYTIGNDTTYNFNSFSSAINTMIAYGICGPVVFQIDTGIFNEQVNIPFIPGSSSSNTITFKGKGSGTILTYNTTSSYRPVVLLDGANFIQIDSLKIAIGAASSGGHCVQFMNNASNNSISNCILDIPYNTSSAYGCIAVSGSVSSYSTYTDCDNLTFINNSLNGGYFGMYINGENLNHSSGCLIMGNNIQSYHAYGLYIRYTDSIIINKNIIEDRGSNNSGYGVRLNYSHANSEISQNKITISYNNGGTGLDLYNCEGTSSKPLMIFNNFIIQTNSTNTGTINGIVSYYGKYLYYYNNSINITAGGTNSRAFYISGSTSSANISDIKIKNNIFSNKGPGYSIYLNAALFPTKLTECNYNDLYSTGTYLAYNSGARTDLAAWKTSATNIGVNSISQNPLFLNDTNLHLSPTSPNNLGTPIPGITIDIDGDTRSLTNPDMGADEYNFLAHDLLITQYITPNSSFCGNVNDSIRVILKSLGLNAETNILITAKVNTPTGIVTVSTIISSIPVGFNDTVVVGAINTTSSGNYSYKVYPTLAFDLNHSNDTVIGNTITEYPISIPHIENFSNSGPYNWTGNNFTVSNIGSHGLTSKALSANLNSTINSAIFNFNKKVSSITANTYLSFKYRITNYSGGASILNGDSLRVLISNDCGNTYSVLHTIDTINHIPNTSMQTVILPIGNFTGTEILIGFNSKRNSGNYWVDIDDVAIAEAPIVNLGNDTTICSGDSCTFDAGSYSPYNVTYEWFVVGNPVILGTSQLYSTSLSANYYVEVKNEYGIIGRDTISLTFDSIPIINLGTDFNICGGDSKTLNAGVGTGYSYLWSNNSTSQIISIDSAGYGLGTHVFWVIITNSNECYTTDSIDVTFLPQLTINIGSDAIICASDSITLNASAGLWYFWSDSSTTQSISVDTVGFGLGKKTVWLMVGDSLGCKTTDTIDLTFIPNPIIDIGSDTIIKYSNGAIILDAGSGFTSYLWDNMSLIQIRQIFASVVGLGVHTYYVDVTDSNGCTASDTIVIEVIDDTGINGVGNDISILIFPNPTKGLFNISIKGIRGEFDMQIVDAVGRKIIDEHLNNNSFKFSKQFDLSCCPKGVYFIKITSNNNVFIERIIIQ